MQIELFGEDYTIDKRSILWNMKGNRLIGPTKLIERWIEKADVFELRKFGGALKGVFNHNKKVYWLDIDFDNKIISARNGEGCIKGPVHFRNGYVKE